MGSGALPGQAPGSLIGEIAAVTITEIASNSLFGTLAQKSPQQPAQEAVPVGAGA